MQRASRRRPPAPWASLVDTDQSVIAAGGYIIQMLPGASDELTARLEENIRNAGAVTGGFAGSYVLRN